MLPEEIEVGNKCGFYLADEGWQFLPKCAKTLFYN